MGRHVEVRPSKARTAASRPACRASSDQSGNAAEQPTAVRPIRPVMPRSGPCCASGRSAGSGSCSARPPSATGSACSPPPLFAASQVQRQHRPGRRVRRGHRGPAAARAGARPGGRRLRRPVRPALDDGHLRPAAVRALRLDPARRARSAPRRGLVVGWARDRHLPDRVGHPALDPGQGGRGPQPDPAGPAGGGQPAHPDHHVRPHPGRRRRRRWPCSTAASAAPSAATCPTWAEPAQLALCFNAFSRLATALVVFFGIKEISEAQRRRGGARRAEHVPAVLRGLEVHRPDPARPRPGAGHLRRVRRRRHRGRHRQVLRQLARRRRRRVLRCSSARSSSAWRSASGSAR